MLIELLILWGVFTTGLWLATLLCWRVNHGVMRENIEEAKRREANAHMVAEGWQDRVDEYECENRTLRRLLTQQLDAVRKASHALSPSDEWLAMLSKIADEDESKPCG